MPPVVFQREAGREHTSAVVARCDDAIISRCAAPMRHIYSNLVAVPHPPPANSQRGIC